MLLGMGAANITYTFMCKSKAKTMAKLKTLVRTVVNPCGPEAFNVARTVFRKIFRQRYPFHWPDLDWLSDQQFWAVMERYGEGDALNAHRRKFLFEYARYAVSRVGGNTAECGVFQGLGSHLICMARKERGGCAGHHLIFDSFDGLSTPSSEDGSYWAKGDLTCNDAIVRTNLAEFDFIKYLQGWIPTRFGEVADERFCFVHIDVDLAVPTRESLEFFYPRVESGGGIVVDDYGFSSCPGVTMAVENFVKKNAGAFLLRLPAGGAIISK